MANEERLGFREWTTHYEKEQESDRKKIGTLVEGFTEMSRSIGALSADVRTLMENQRGMFDKINRPTQWGVLVSAALLVAVILGLVTGPMKGELENVKEELTLETRRNLEVDLMFNQRLGEQIRVTTANEVNLQWMMKVEERMNQRLHKALSE